MLTLGEVVPVRQREGEMDWVEEMLTVTELQYVPEAVLPPDSEALGDWLILKVEVMVPDTHPEEDTLGL